MRTKILASFLVCLAACTLTPVAPTGLPVASSTPVQARVTSSPAASPSLAALPTITTTATVTVTPSPEPTPFALPELDVREYIALTEAEAIQVARRLNYLANDGHPSNMSGPLALAILRDAGIVGPDVDLHDFWLLDPRQATHLLETTFPRRDFLWFQTTTPANTFDFGAFPCQVGDLLYFYAGPGDTFEHFLVVTRLDASGNAFATTSRNTPAGYVIEELPLANLLATWADPQQRTLGLTGGGGFSLWRQRKTVGASPAERLVHALDETLITYGGDWQVLIQQTGEDVLYSKDAGRPVHIASVIKLPIALLFLKSIETQSGNDLPGYLDSHGTEGRSYRQLLTFMLVRSEEDATESLQRAIPANGLDMDATLKAWGLANTQIGPRQSTAQDVARMLAGLYRGEFVNDAARQLLLELLSTYTANDAFRLGSLREKVPGVAVYNKRGTLTDPLLIVADAALVVWNEGDQTLSFEVVLLARSPGPQAPVTYELLDQAMDEVASLFAQYLRDTVADYGN